MTATVPHGTTLAESRVLATITELEQTLSALVEEATVLFGSTQHNSTAFHIDVAHASSTENASHLADLRSLCSRADNLVKRVEMAYDENPSSAQLPHLQREAQALSGRLYLRLRNVPKALDHMLQQVIATRPVDPVQEMIDMLDRMREARRTISSPLM